MKLLFLILILQVSNEQTALNIDILGGEINPSCENNTGKMEFTSEYTISSQEEINSYFQLNLKDSSNKKHISICSLSFSPNSTQNGIEPHLHNLEPILLKVEPILLKVEQSFIKRSKSISKGTIPTSSGANPSQSGANPSQSGVRAETFSEWD